MRESDVVKGGVNVTIIVTAEEQISSVYLLSDLGHWDSSVTQGPKLEKALWGGHFISCN